MIGRTIGHFRLVGHLGRGASGTVYRAVDDVLGREVALKILNPSQVDPDAVARFRAEATTLAKLNHPAIATIYELLESDGHVVMAMECASGETLEQLSERLGPLPPERATALIDRMLAALDHAHRAGVLHCDIKPANVMVCDGEVKIMDFGIARMLGGEHAADAGLLGTPAYMAPEQVLGQPLDARTDLYAVGVILYRLLTATLPFDGDTPAAVLQRQVAEPPPPLHTRRGDLPGWCEPIVQRALAKLSADRFQTADEFRDALSSAVAVVPIRSEPRATVGRLRPVFEALALASAAGVAALIAYGGFRHRAPVMPAAPSAPATVVTAAPIPPDPAPQPAALPSAAAAPDPASPSPEPRAEKPVRPPLPQLEFDTRALVADGRKARERDARLVLADRNLTIMDEEAGRLLYSVPYDSVTSINYSHSRDPLWASPEGTAPVVRATGGVLRTLGFSVDRDWVSLVTRTNSRFVVIRVAEGELTQLLAALQERTHRTVRRLEPKGDGGGRPVL